MICAELVDGCNLRCALCWNRNRKGSFDQMEMKTVQDILKKFPNERIDWFDWGEPLLHKNFIEIARTIKGTKSNISSNFSLELPDSYFKEIQNFNTIFVSFSGMDEETYNKYHCGGNFGLVVRNIKKLIDQKNTKICMQYLYHQDNKDQFSHALEFFTDMGFDEVNKVRLNCEIEEWLNGFKHPYLRDNYGCKKEGFHCVPFHRLTIGVHGEHFLCCMTHNVPVHVTIYDMNSREEVMFLKKKHPLCAKCQEKEIWRKFS